MPFGVILVSRFIICMSSCDCCCLFRVLIQSPGFLWWTGLDRTKKKKTYIFMCLLCYHFREVCESHSCFEERVSTFVFSAVRKYTFLRADATLQHFCSGQIESSLVRIRFKGNPQVFAERAGLLMETEEIQLNVQF